MEELCASGQIEEHLILCIPLQTYSNPSTWGHLGTSVRNERWCCWQTLFVAVSYVNKFKQAKFKPNCFCWWQSICWISFCVEWINTMLTILSQVMHLCCCTERYSNLQIFEFYLFSVDLLSRTGCTNMPLFVTHYHFLFWYSWLQTSDLFPWGKRENGHFLWYIQLWQSTSCRQNLMIYVYILRWQLRFLTSI